MEDHSFSFRDEEGGHSVSSQSVTSHYSSDSKPSSTLRRDEQLTSAETRLVNRSKCLVYFALAVAAAAVSTTAFKVLKKDEENTMKVEVR